MSHVGEHDQTICVGILGVSRLRNDRVIGLGRGRFFVLSTFLYQEICKGTPFETTSISDVEFCLKSPSFLLIFSCVRCDTGTYGLKGHWGLKGHFYKTSILAKFGDSLMMRAISMSSWVIDTMFSPKNHVSSRLFQLEGN